MPQGLFSFIYDEEKTGSGATALAGLPVYLELAAALGLPQSIRKCLGGRPRKQGWSDEQIIMALLCLMLAGGDCVDDLEILERDAGFADLMRQAEKNLGLDVSTEESKRRWRKGRGRTVPSQAAVFRFLEGFHDPEQEKLRQRGKASIPRPNERLVGLVRINTGLIAALAAARPSRTATLDMDATLVETRKRDALWCYKGYQSYQPFNTYWAEQDVILHSEFRDGNVPAGHQQLRLLEEALAALPESVKDVFVRSDTAAYQVELLRYCAHGKNKRFGVILFAIGCDVTPTFRNAVASVPEEDWKPLFREEGGQSYQTRQEWAEVSYTPWDLYRNREDAPIRFIAVREALAEQPLPGLENELSLPFPTITLPGRKQQVTYKLHAIATNRDCAGPEVITWYRQRCGKSEEAHSVLKEDLPGGQLPTGKFGANAAWWAIVVLASNLHSLMKHLALKEVDGPGWEGRRMKAVRFRLMRTPGRVVRHAGQLLLRMARGHPALKLLISVRKEIVGIARRIRSQPNSPVAATV